MKILGSLARIAVSLAVAASLQGCIVVGAAAGVAATGVKVSASVVGTTVGVATHTVGAVGRTVTGER